MFCLDSRGLGLRGVLALFIVISGNSNGSSEANTQSLEIAPSLLSIQYLLQEEGPVPGAPTPETFSDRLPHIDIAATPEPYSYVLAAFGVFGILAMGSVFRKRKNLKKPDDKRKRVTSSSFKYRHTMSR